MMFHVKKKHSTDERALNWIQELKILRKNGKRQCQTCAQYFNSLKDLRLHIRDRQCQPENYLDEEKLRPFGCPCCKRTYKNRDDMMFHLKKKHPTEEEALKWIQELKILRQNGKRQCQTCAQYFDSTKDLRLHIRARQCQPENYLDDEELRPFGCPCCKRTYKNRDDMMFHLKKKHPTEEEALKWIQELKILRQ